MQDWGGPRTYSEQRGHPRLRMRHAPFVIGPLEHDAWLRRMLAALLGLKEAGRISEPDVAELRDDLEYGRQLARQHRLSRPEPLSAQSSKSGVRPSWRAATPPLRSFE